MKVTKEQLLEFYQGDWLLIGDSGNIYRDKVFVDDLSLDGNADEESWPDVINTKNIEGVINTTELAPIKISLSGVEFRIGSDGVSFASALIRWIKTTYAKSKTFVVTVPDEDMAAFEAFTKEKGIRIKILK